MTNYYPQEPANYLYKPGQQWTDIARTETVSEIPLINIDYAKDGEIVGLEVIW